MAAVGLYWAKFDFWAASSNRTFQMDARDFILGTGDYGNFIHFDTFPDSSWQKRSIPIIYCSAVMLVLLLSAIQGTFHSNLIFVLVFNFGLGIASEIGKETKNQLVIDS